MTPEMKKGIYYGVGAFVALLLVGIILGIGIHLGNQAAEKAAAKAEAKAQQKQEEEAVQEAIEAVKSEQEQLEEDFQTRYGLTGEQAYQACVQKFEERIAYNQAHAGEEVREYFMEEIERDSLFAASYVEEYKDVAGYYWIFDENEWDEEILKFRWSFNTDTKAIESSSYTLVRDKEGQPQIDVILQAKYFPWLVRESGNNVFYYLYTFYCQMTDAAYPQIVEVVKESYWTKDDQFEKIVFDSRED